MRKQINKVLLLTPPVLSSKNRVDINPYPPLGLAYIAAVLKQMDIEVKIVDCYLEGIKNKIEWNEDSNWIGLSIESIIKELCNFSPDLVGISQMFSRQTGIVKYITKGIKRYYNIQVILGGAHVSAIPKYYIENMDIDFIITGEGELSINALISNIERGINQNQKIYGYSVDDLNYIPFPDWEVANLENYFGSKMSHGYRKKKRFAPVITSRGCPMKCSFCSAHCVWGNKYRIREVNNVMNELSMLEKECDVKEIMFEDDNLTLDKKRAKNLFRLMSWDCNLVWDTPNGIAAWTMDEELLSLMKAAGCYKVNFAIESGSKRVLKDIIKKPVDLDYSKKMISYARKIGLDIGVFLVIGMPTETEEERQMSYDFCKDVGIYFPHISIATPYPGSSLYEKIYDENMVPSIEFLESLHIRNKLVKKEVTGSLKIAEKRFLIEAIKKDIFNVIKNFIKVFFANPLKAIRRILGLFYG